VNYFVTATFDSTPPESFPIAVATNGEGTVKSTPAGIDCGAVCAAPFKTGSTVTLTASPAAGWSFAGWGGACQGTGPCALTIDGPKSVEATFRPPSFMLTVATAGRGSVSSSPGGIACGSTCTVSFASGGTVTLSANPDSGATFVAWGGACAGAGSSCSVTMSEARAVTAVFTGASRLPLAVATSGTGAVTSAPAGISCGETCGATYAQGATVTLTATPAAGWRLAAWGGACTGSARTCSVTMAAARGVTAAFARAPRSYPLAVTVGGNGVVTSSPAGIRCPPTCTKSMTAGARVTLTATPAAKSTLVRWSGACTGRKRTCTVSMTAPRTVTATFALNADQQPPRVTALPSSGARGAVVRLRYRVTDDSGKSREWATVYRGKRSIAVVRGRLDEADPDALFYFLPWKAPSSLPSGVLRFCVQAADPTGNTSKRSCAKVRLT
jgi:NOL1/NOP2/fmu family ribosome biogenesis protein